MKLGSAIKLNTGYISALNSCSRIGFDDFMTIAARDFYDRGMLHKFFTRKRYLWNIVRNGDFYRMMSLMISDLGKKGEKEFAVALLLEIINTTKNVTTLTKFVTGVVKRFPVLTCDTVPYIECSWLLKILESDDIEDIFADGVYTTILDYIVDLRSQALLAEML